MSTIFSKKELQESLSELIDETITLSEEIKALKALHINTKEEKLKAMKKKIENEMLDNEIKEIVGDLGHAKYVIRNSKTVNMDKLCIDYAITNEIIDTYSTHKESKYVKITSK